MSTDPWKNYASDVAQQLSHLSESQQAEIICHALGIDPELDIDTLRRRLLWGEAFDKGLTAGRGVHSWLTRPESTETPPESPQDDKPPQPPTETPDDSQETT